MASDESVLRRAVEDDRDGDGWRDHGAESTDQGRRGEWRRRPPEREQDVRTVDDQARDALEDAAVVNHVGATGGSSRSGRLRRGPRVFGPPRFGPHMFGRRVFGTQMFGKSRALAAGPVASRSCSC